MVRLDLFDYGRDLLPLSYDPEIIAKAIKRKNRLQMGGSIEQTVDEAMTWLEGNNVISSPGLQKLCCIAPPDLDDGEIIKPGKAAFSVQRSQLL